jgi:hypothetical protein
MENHTSLISTILGFIVCVVLTPSAAQAINATEVEPNNAIGVSQNIDNYFSTGANPDIQDAEIWPWVSISASGDGTFDYYAFEVPAGGVIGVFDIDYGYVNDGVGSLDTELCLYASDGTLLANNDDSSSSYIGAGGSTLRLDSYLSYAFEMPGTYVIGVGKYNTYCNPNGMTGNTPDTGETYELQVSLSAHVVDSDGDGVADDVDCNPYSDLNPTVVFESCDSGVSNTLFADGCSISDLTHACADDAKNHGTFSSCMAAVTNDLRKSGEITGSGRSMIQSCAAQSDMAK